MQCELAEYTATAFLDQNDITGPNLLSLQIALRHLPFTALKSKAFTASAASVERR